MSCNNPCVTYPQCGQCTQNTLPSEACLTQNALLESFKCVTSGIMYNTIPDGFVLAWDTATSCFLPVEPCCSGGGGGGDCCTTSINGITISTSPAITITNGPGITVTTNTSTNTITISAKPFIVVDPNTVETPSGTIDFVGCGVFNPVVTATATGIEVDICPTPGNDGDVLVSTASGPAWVAPSATSGDALFMGIFATAPATAVTGSTYQNSGTGDLYYYDGASWVLIPLASGSADGGHLGIFATAPSGAIAGDQYYNTTDGTTYQFDGTVWNAIPGGDASTLGSFATAPTATITGDTYYNTTTNGYYRWDGTSWVLLFTIPTANPITVGTAPACNTLVISAHTGINTSGVAVNIPASTFTIPAGLSGTVYVMYDVATSTVIANTTGFLTDGTVIPLGVATVPTAGGCITAWTAFIDMPEAYQAGGAQGLDATIAMNVGTLPGGGSITRPFSYRDTDEYSFVVMTGNTGVIITKTHVPTQTTQSITLTGPVGTTNTHFCGGVVLNGYTYIGIAYQISGNIINNIYYVQNTANISTLALTTNIGLPNLGVSGAYQAMYIYSDGTDMYIANDGGILINSTHVFRKASISAGTITSVSTITYGASATAFGTQAGVAFQAGYCHSHNGVIPGVLGVTTANYDVFNITGGASLFPPIPMKTASFPYVATNYNGDIYTHTSSTSEATVPSTVMAKSIYNK